MDLSSETIMNSIAALVTQITQDRVLSPALVEKVRKIVIDIGQLMSLVEDFRFDPKYDTESLIPEFIKKKDALYINCNDLVSAASANNDGFALSNSLGQMLENTTSVLESVEEVIVASKLLIDQKDILMFQQSMSDVRAETDSALRVLQQRAMTLSFEGTEPASAKTERSSRRSFLSSSSEWTQSARSADSRLGPKVPESSMRKKSTSSQDFGDASAEGYPKSPAELGSANKLAKFFGEDSVAGAPARMSDSNRPWFLKKEVTNDLSYNMEGSVNGGTFAALVARLTVHDQIVGIINLA
jgi:hypothetical protein